MAPSPMMQMAQVRDLLKCMLLYGLSWKLIDSLTGIGTEHVFIECTHMLLPIFSETCLLVATKDNILRTFPLCSDKGYERLTNKISMEAFKWMGCERVVYSPSTE